MKPSSDPGRVESAKCRQRHNVAKVSNFCSTTLPSLGPAGAQPSCFWFLCSISSKNMRRHEKNGKKKKRANFDRVCQARSLDQTAVCTARSDAGPRTRRKSSASDRLLRELSQLCCFARVAIYEYAVILLVAGIRNHISRVSGALTRRKRKQPIPSGKG